MVNEVGTSSRSERALLAAVLVSAAVLRALHCFKGLPYLYEWDEPLIASRALDMLKTGDLNPRAFEYGSFALYMNLAVDYLQKYWQTWVATGAAPLHEVGRAEIRTFLDTSWLWTFSHPSFLLWNRFLSALIGTATVGLVYLLARRIAGIAAGLLSAALLAGLDYHVVQSALVLPNVTIGCFAVLVAWLSVRYFEDGGAVPFVTAVSACGLAASTKYNAAIFLVVPLAALIFGTHRGGPRRRPWLWGALVVLPPVAFLAGTPYALIEWDLFTRDVSRQAREYFLSGHGEATIQPGLGHLWHQAASLAANLGPLVCVLALLGLGSLVLSRAGRLALILPTSYLLYMAATRVSFHRNFVLVYPFAAIAAGCGGAMLVRMAAWIAASRGWPQSPVRIAAMGLAALVPLYLIAVSATAGIAVASRAESRSRAVDWVNARVASRPGAITRIRIAEELRMHPEDLLRLESPAIVEPLESILCDPAQTKDLVIVAPRYDRAPLRTPADAAIRNSLAARLPPPAAVMGEQTLLIVDGFIREPLLHFIPGVAFAEMPPLECGPVISGSSLIPLEEAIERRDGVARIPQGGVARTPALLLTAGRHALVLRVQGNPERSWRPTLTARILRKSGDGMEEELRSEAILLGLERVSRMITLDVEASAVLTLQLEFNEEPNRERPWVERAITVESMRLIRLPD